VILNDLDWAQMQALKDSQQRYLGGGPFVGSSGSQIWNMPVVATPSMPQTEFLVGRV